MKKLIVRGRLRVTLPGGETRSYGPGGGRDVAITIADRALVRQLMIAPEMGLGEGYMDGRLVIHDDALHDFMWLLLDNLNHADYPALAKVLQRGQQLMRRFAQFNPVGKAQANVAHHYDLSGALYDLFLDADKQYSCAYFAKPDMSLEEAQAAKKHHIARKLRIKPGMRVLDIGCGWGGMGLTLARDYGAQVVGVTLSKEQHAVATRRAAEAGLSDRVDFRLTDYRHLDERFDRIVSVGMFEHVGVPHYREYFGHVHKFLAEDGIALIHTIGRIQPPGVTSPWILKYIFPGGYVPAMSEALAAIEKEDFFVTDVETWRLHYAETLKHWYDRFMANDAKAEALYDARFVRMWRFYLVASELMFRLRGQVVFQFQLTKSVDAVPLTRDYLYEGQARPAHLQAAE